MKNKIHSKQISVLFGLFFIVIIYGCKNETGKLSREQAPDPYHIRGADIYLVSNDIALPFENPKPIAFHPIVKKLAPSALAYYRWKDKQKPKF